MTNYIDDIEAIQNEVIKQIGTSSTTFRAPSEGGTQFANNAILFFDDKNNLVGTLSWKNGKLHFDGDISKSAKKFLATVGNLKAIEDLRK